MKLPFFKVGLQFAVFQAGLLLCQTASAAVGFIVTPPIVTNTYTGPITLQVTGLTAGDTVLVQRFLDANADGVINAGDILWQQFTMTDGQGGMVIGGVTNINVPGDTDTVAGQVTAGLDFQTDFSPPIAGNYLYKLSSPSGHFTPITKSFTVTNFHYGQSFTGTVVSNRVAVPYASVILLQSSGGNNLNTVGGTVANNSGNYTVQAAPGTYTLLAFKSNFVANTGAAGNLVLGSGASISTNLILIPATQTISGQIIDANSSVGLPGLLLSAQSSDGLFGICFADTNGNFSMGVTADQWKVEGDSGGLALLGYLDLQNKPKLNTGSGSVSGVTIALPKATALFYGTVEDNVGKPFPGVAIFAGDDNGIYQADGYTDTNGSYVVTALGGLGSNDLWSLTVDNASSFPNFNFSQPLFDQNGGTNLAIGVAVPVNFTSVLATNLITGNVQFNGAPVSGVQVNAGSEDAHSYQSQATTDNNGNYSMNVGNANWYVTVNCQGGDNSLDGIIGGGNYQCPCGTNVTIANDNGTASFIVSGGGSGEIFGYVRDTVLKPIIGVSVSATDCNGDNYSTSTDGSGYYLFNVGNGNWEVSVDCGGLNWLGYLCLTNQSVTVSSDSVEQNFYAQSSGSSGGPPPGVGSPAKSGAQCQFLLSGASGQNYTLQLSTNLSSGKLDFAVHD